MTIAQEAEVPFSSTMAITISATFGDETAKEIGSLQRLIVICSDIEIASFAMVISAWRSSLCRLESSELRTRNMMMKVGPEQSRINTRCCPWWYEKELI
jgi:hypothetical protein